MKHSDEHVEAVREKAKKTEKQLKEKRRERTEKNSSQISINERLIAPALLLITILISYLILLFR